MRSVLMVVLLCLAVGSMTTAQAPGQSRREFLSVLKSKQSVVLKETAGHFAISTMDEVGGTLTHKIVEVGADFIAVEDAAGVRQMRIPVYAISSITRIKLAKE